MMAYLRSVWLCRFFWMSLVKMDLRTRYRGSFLGLGWSLLNPVLMTSIICMVVATALIPQDPWSYAPFLFAGLTFWSYVVGVTQTGCQCFFQGQSYIRQFPAPMAIYPLRAVLSCAFHYSTALLLVIVLSALMRGVFQPIALLWVAPAWLLLLMLGWSVATLLGLLHIRFRDTSHMMDIVLQVLFYATPILYPPSALDGKKLGMVLQLNPLVPFLRILREPIVDGRLPAPGVYLAAVLIVAVAVTSASVALRLGERRLIFHL